MRSKTLVVVVLAAGLALGLSWGAQAALLDGNTINYQYYYPSYPGSPYSSAANGDTVVGAGVEVSNIVDSTGTLDASDTNILIDFTRGSTFSPGSFNGFEITDALGTIDGFTSVTINPATNMVGLDASRIFFDADHIRVNWVDLSFTSDTIVSLDINGGGGNGRVPAPAAVILLGSGLLGLAGAAGLGRRRK